ncbi:hypothetical protein B0H10DRAFT_1951348 [Mycena sp. CBHHK59/15]|nr:hypothetical protein B0H10DRAFT_1951348 [Mycena sp. CBHHK59/15]
MSQILIPHSDPRILYSSLWTTCPGPVGSEHTTTTIGESFNFRFNMSEGATIEVHRGIRPTTANISILARSAYVIDDAGGRNTAFYNSSALSAGPHTLFVRMLSDNPYYLDYIQINDASDDPPTLAAAAASPAATNLDSNSPPIGAVVGVIAGGALMFCLLGALFIYSGEHGEPILSSSFLVSPLSEIGVEAVVTPFTQTSPSLSARYKQGTRPTTAVVSES